MALEEDRDQTTCPSCAENEKVRAEIGMAPSEDVATNWWHCRRCGSHLERWRGESDVSCSCGAEYNSGGQLLRDDWRRNPSNDDDEIGDLEGYELAHAGD